MKSTLDRILPVIPWLLLTGLFLCEPALANKFETIGSGVQGSTQAKIEYLKVIAYVAAGIFMIAGIASIVLHDKNAQTLNYTMWKVSSALFFLFAIGAFAVAVLMK